MRTWLSENVNSMLVLMLTNKKKQLRPNYGNNENVESIIVNRHETKVICAVYKNITLSEAG